MIRNIYVLLFIMLALSSNAWAKTSPEYFKDLKAINNQFQNGQIIVLKQYENDNNYLAQVNLIIAKNLNSLHEAEAQQPKYHSPSYLQPQNLANAETIKKNIQLVEDDKKNEIEANNRQDSYASKIRQECRALADYKNNQDVTEKFLDYTLGTETNSFNKEMLAIKIRFLNKIEEGLNFALSKQGSYRVQDGDIVFYDRQDLEIMNQIITQIHTISDEALNKLAANDRNLNDNLPKHEVKK